MSNKGMKLKEGSQTRAGENTIRVVLDFNKFRSLKDTDFAYNVLNSKEKKKSEYITNAIEYYDKYAWKSDEVRSALSTLRCIRFIRERYSIETKDDLKKLLSIDQDGDDFAMIESHISHKKAAKILCGFFRGKERARNMAARLSGMQMNERVPLVVNSIVAYVEDGFDAESRGILAYRILRDSILEFQSHENEQQEIFLDNMFILVNSCEDIQSSFPVNVGDDEVKKNISKEILELFIDKRQIDEFLR